MTWGNEFASLANEISKINKERADHIRELKRDIKQTKSNWNRERATMKTEFLSNFNAWDKERIKKVDDLKGVVQMSLKKFRDEDMARIKKESKERAQNIAQFKHEVGKMISEFRKDRDLAAAAWQELVSGIGPGQKKKRAVKEEVGEKKKQSRRKKA